MSCITRNPKVCSGSPTITGTRLTVYDVVDGIAENGYELYIETFGLEPATADECITYCANLRCHDIQGVDLAYCYACVLDKRDSNSMEDAEEVTLANGTNIIKNGSETFFGNFAEYLQSREKIKGWELAESLLLGGH